MASASPQPLLLIPCATWEGGREGGERRGNDAAPLAAPLLYVELDFIWARCLPSMCESALVYAQCVTR